MIRDVVALDARLGRVDVRGGLEARPSRQRKSGVERATAASFVQDEERPVLKASRARAAPPALSPPRRAVLDDQTPAAEDLHAATPAAVP